MVFQWIYNPVLFADFLKKLKAVVWYFLTYGKIKFFRIINAALIRTNTINFFFKYLISIEYNLLFIITI